ncbi:hypothetical protein [Blautia obeum]|uniref:Uncharacterized protein n=1 Tax=Blautia obeum TaxID=40520 RepID=A0A411ZUK1_9FIRM|nr:hypothetical protein [Blautia obeum]RGQ06486.1 hypothetical protein DWZ12_04680 [Blautia obeum]
MGYIIDDNPYTPDPREPGIIYIIAQKQGKNGNVKKTVALRTAGGTHTDEQVTRLVQETEGSCVTISIVGNPSCKVIDDEVKFMKIVKKMMK